MNKTVFLTILSIFALGVLVLADNPANATISVVPSDTPGPADVTSSATPNPTVTVIPGNITPDIGCPKGYMETSRYEYSKALNDSNFTCPLGDIRVNDRTSQTDVNYIICCSPKKPAVDNFTCAPRKFVIPQRPPIGKRLSERLCSLSRGSIKYRRLPHGKSQEWCCNAKLYVPKKVTVFRQCLLWSDQVQ